MDNDIKSLMLDLSDIIGGDIEERVLSPEDSAKARKEMAKPTGDAVIARELHGAFLKARVSKAMNDREWLGVKGKVAITNPETGKKHTTNALFWYRDRKKPTVSVEMVGSIRVISLVGRKGKDGLYSRISILKRMPHEKEVVSYLGGKAEDVEAAPIGAKKILEELNKALDRDISENGEVKVCFADAVIGD